MRNIRLTTVRDGNTIYVLVLYQDGSRQTIGAFLLPNDGQWREDVYFLDDIKDAYRKRLSKMI